MPPGGARRQPAPTGRSWHERAPSRPPPAPPRLGGRTGGVQRPEPCRTALPGAEEEEEEEEGAAMGLLSQGSLLSWEETQHHVDHMQRHGILQFLHIYHAVKERHKDVLKWGNELQ